MGLPRKRSQDFQLLQDGEMEEGIHKIQ
ncbi:hypothetical protein AT4G21063, partial [Arabidopsis thaliana]